MKKRKKRICLFCLLFLILFIHQTNAKYKIEKTKIIQLIYEDPKITANAIDI